MSEYGLKITSVEYILEKVINPAMDERLPKEIIHQARNAYKKISNMERAGDVYRYLLKAIENDKKSETTSLFSEYGLNSFEDVIDEFRIKFASELGDCSTMQDLVLNMQYTSNDIAVMANNYDIFKGIIGVKNDSNNNVGIVLKANVEQKDSQTYGNKWLSKNERIIYFLEKSKDDDLPKYNTERHSAILNNKLPLYLFETISVKNKNVFQYKGIYKFVRMSEEYPDLAVELVNTLQITENLQFFTEIEKEAEKKLLSELEQPILEPPVGSTKVEIRQVVSNYYERDQAVAAYALKKANGHCELCGNPAPFIKKSNGYPYLEVHHMVPLSQGGSDTVDNVKALCPNCHRKEHFG